MLLACAYRVMDARGKFGEHSRSEFCSRLRPRETLTLLSVQPLTRYTHATHEPVVNFHSNRCGDLCTVDGL